RATLAQRAYCIANPGHFKGYGENLWGITACDGPTGYKARGAPPAQNDDGTIAPTAAGGSIVFTPEYSIPLLRNLYDTYRSQLWTQYGFRDAFNLTVNWWGPDVIGIDQGTIVIMIENYRTGRVWERFMENEDIQRGLQRAGFTSVNAVKPAKSAIPAAFSLDQNYPNPFNAETVISYTLRTRSKVQLQLYDVRGRLVSTLVDTIQNAGHYRVRFDGGKLTGGVLLCVLKTESGRNIRKITLLK
ncbi:T9SS type A sorting domain-containing protein, partial [candidate division KSB1 bacterium]|nr:T9SS type A sorting domain-containing protein [candidate division KSB1 bacterium]